MTPELTTAIVVGGLLVTILAMLAQILKDSAENRRMARKKERKAIIKLVSSLQKFSANPDVRDFRRLVISEINERNARD